MTGAAEAINGVAPVERGTLLDVDRQPGHSVLQVPVPPLETWVRERARHYDADWVSADTDFGHAHVTALGPWLSHPAAVDLHVVASIAATTAAFTFTLSDVAAFPDGILHARPQPGGAFGHLTARLAAAFPQCPPYEGRYDEIVPHLTLDACSAGVGIDSTRAALGSLLPARCVASHLQLAWYEAGACRVLASWPLEGPVG